MQIHTLTLSKKNKTKKRVGRGGARGTYSGRGIKGQKAHAGRGIRPEFRDIIKKKPKQRGYRRARRGRFLVPKLTEIARINVDILEKKFSSGDEISPNTLSSIGLVKKIGGGIPRIKILGRGNLSKKLVISGCTISKNALEKVKKAGGNFSV